MMPLTPGRNQPSNDLVFTPAALALEIIQHFPLAGRVLDPARGDGAFYNLLPAALEKDWCEVREERNFYYMHEPFHWIITNPPWSHMRTWLEHCMRVAPDIVLLCTLTHFCTKARLRDLQKRGYGLKEFYCVATPPAPWPASGFQLGAMHLQCNYAGPLHITGKPGA